MNKTPSLSSVVWRWFNFTELTTQQLHDIFRLRQAAFVVEQECPYADIDGQDPFSLHLIGTLGQEIIAYLRLIPPQDSNNPIYFGRVVVTKKLRGQGFAKELIQQVLNYIDEYFPDITTVISAQSYLAKFYAKFDFYKIGAPYDEDNIEHIAMRRNPLLK